MFGGGLLYGMVVCDQLNHKIELLQLEICSYAFIQSTCINPYPGAGRYSQCVIIIIVEVAWISSTVSVLAEKC